MAEAEGGSKRSGVSSSEPGVGRLGTEGRLPLPFLLLYVFLSLFLFLVLFSFLFFSFFFFFARGERYKSDN